MWSRTALRFPVSRRTTDAGSGCARYLCYELTAPCQETSAVGQDTSPHPTPLCSKSWAVLTVALPPARPSSSYPLCLASGNAVRRERSRASKPVQRRQERGIREGGSTISGSWVRMRRFHHIPRPHYISAPRRSASVLWLMRITPRRWWGAVRAQHLEEPRVWSTPSQTGGTRARLRVRCEPYHWGMRALRPRPRRASAAQANRSASHSFPTNRAPPSAAAS